MEGKHAKGLFYRKKRVEKEWRIEPAGPRRPPTKQGFGFLTVASEMKTHRM